MPICFLIGLPDFTNLLWRGISSQNVLNLARLWRWKFGNHQIAYIHPSSEIHHRPQLVSRIGSTIWIIYWNDAFLVSVISQKNPPLFISFLLTWCFLVGRHQKKAWQSFSIFLPRFFVRRFFFHSLVPFFEAWGFGLLLHLMSWTDRLYSWWAWLKITDHFEPPKKRRHGEVLRSQYWHHKQLWEHKPCKKTLKEPFLGAQTWCWRPFRCESPAVSLEVIRVGGAMLGGNHWNMTSYPRTKPNLHVKSVR